MFILKKAFAFKKIFISSVTSISDKMFPLNKTFVITKIFIKNRIFISNENSILNKMKPNKTFKFYAYSTKFYKNFDLNQYCFPQSLCSLFNKKISTQTFFFWT